MNPVTSKAFYCPVCRSAREIPVLKTSSLKIFIPSFAAGCGIGILCGIALSVWPAFWIGLFGFLLSFMGLEIYYNRNSKRELVCPVCSFDPVLFRRSPEKAKEQCLKGFKGKKNFYPLSSDV